MKMRRSLPIAVLAGLAVVASALYADETPCEKAGGFDPGWDSTPQGVCRCPSAPSTPAKVIAKAKADSDSRDGREARSTGCWNVDVTISANGQPAVTGHGSSGRTRAVTPKALGGYADESKIKVRVKCVRGPCSGQEKILTDPPETKWKDIPVCSPLPPECS